MLPGGCSCCLSDSCSHSTQAEPLQKGSLPSLPFPSPPGDSLFRCTVCSFLLHTAAACCFFCACVPLVAGLSGTLSPLFPPPSSFLPPLSGSSPPPFSSPCEWSAGSLQHSLTVPSPVRSCGHGWRSCRRSCWTTCMPSRWRLSRTSSSGSASSSRPPCR